MAMMMAGRVLLVCALCVLWCGAVFGHAMEDYCGEGGGNGLRQTSNGGGDGVSLKADCGLLSARTALIKAVEAAETGQELSGDPDQLQDKSNLSSPDNKLGNNTQSTGAPGSEEDIVAVQPPAAPLGSGGSGTGGRVVKPEGLDTAVGRKAGNKEDRNDGTATGPKLQTVDQSSPSSSASGSPGPQNVEEHNLENTSVSDESSDDSPEGDERDRLSQSDSREEKAEELVKQNELNTENTSHEAPALTAAPAEEARITSVIPAGDSTPAETNGHSKPDDTVTMQQLQHPQDGIESNNDAQTNSGASIAANQHNETSAGHAETTPLPTANGDAANNEADNSTEEGISDSDPADDGAGTREEKQSDNKDANPKETPVETTSMKTTTATTGDSDGSTAVSHTTSPLLLLLVVACAAAAAVVAA
ncbi:mucin-associated surface protein (MASP) [Trypanosoma cruzi Dm28c]|uniref:Mucin-associated surface protein (MASP) n=2 Tax=Trypanosoma cruzi TaxID=5693 RepID=V5AQK9_TRYCR|nr:mucin-associated surface protein (MASP) [Trypanosoma cruzi Dm28c]PBJ71324.1 mucin-associated surface protein [Trypanosoma cruzi cruzi]PBJ78656.1 mucin-associated surface protein [Trypanosoma cruzi cruzi]PWU92634.1 Mucin-associated surface protein (MASP) [Trypanosoma cruzi]